MKTSQPELQKKASSNSKGGKSPIQHHKKKPTEQYAQLNFNDITEDKS